MAEPSDAALPSGPGNYPPGDWHTGAGADQAQPGERQASSGPGWSRPAPLRAGAGRSGGPLLAVLAVIVGTALLGVAAGFIWAAVAPRALIVVLGRDSANVVNPETSAFIAADGWFTLLSVAGGVVSGLLGYVLAVRRHGAVAMAAILAGAVAAALLAKWIGEQPGQAAVNHSLALGRPGTELQEPLALGGIGVLAFWPLAAGLVAGGIEGMSLLRARIRRPPGHFGLAVAGPPSGPPGSWPSGQPQQGASSWPPGQPQPGPPGSPASWPAGPPQQEPPQPTG